MSSRSENRRVHGRRRPRRPASLHSLVWWAGVLFVCVSAAVPVSTDAGPLLVDAVRAGDRDAVRTLLKDRAAVGTAEADGTTALHWAARADDHEMMRMLLAAGADAAAVNRYGITPLFLAAVNGSRTAAEILLDAGAPVNVALPEGETILMTAARTGRADVVALLAGRGADLEAREHWYGETALMWAAAENHPEAIRALARAGADLDARSAPLTWARRRSGQSVLPLGSWTPLMYAARQGAVEAASTLLELGADPNLTDPDGATALVLAIINADFDLAALLVEQGADPNIADTEARMGPLYAAIDMNTLAVGHGRPNPAPSGRLSALDLIEILLAHGADPNARLAAPLMQRHHTGGDRALGEGSTPFMRAAKTGDVAAMRLLLAAGADPMLAQPNQNNALMLAAGLGWRDGSPAAPSYDQGSEDAAIEAIRLCLELGFDINAANTAGETALHSAVAGRGSEKIIRFLVEKGASLEARDKRDRTPLDVAMASRRANGPGLAQLLKELAN